jgi:hypothetical protein
MSDNFLGLLPWAPGGYVSAEDERAEQLALANPYWYQRVYLHQAADTLDHGDETFQTNTFAYIPTEIQVAAALATMNAQIMATPDPVTDRTPALAQLTKSLYAQASDLWREIAAADTEGWDV